MNEAVPEELFTDLSVRGFEALFDPASTGADNPKTASAGGTGVSASSMTPSVELDTVVTNTGSVNRDFFATQPDNRGIQPVGTGSNTPLGTLSSIPSQRIDFEADIEETENDTTWSLRAASEKLGLSPNTIRKRIHTGQLRADKIVGTNGPEWRIQPPSNAIDPTSTGVNTGFMSATASINATGAMDSAGIATATHFAGSTQPVIDALLKIIDTQAKQLEVATTQLASSTEHVKAASRIIAYQQLQLEEKDSKVKLLTDSRHHEGWWKKLMHRLPAKK